MNTTQTTNTKKANAGLEAMRAKLAAMSPEERKAMQEKSKATAAARKTAARVDEPKATPAPAPKVDVKAPSFSQTHTWRVVLFHKASATAMAGSCCVQVAAMGPKGASKEAKVRAQALGLPGAIGGVLAVVREDSALWDACSLTPKHTA